MKKLMIGLGVIVIVAAGGLYYLTANAPKIIQAVIQDQGSKVTQVSVKVAKVNLSISDLTAGIVGLTVGNPAGFKTDQAISLGEVSVTIGDISQDLIVVKEVMIRAPEITYEIGSNGSNIDAIQKNVEKFTGAGSDSSAPAASSSGDDSGDSAAPKVIISNLYIKGGKINLSAPFMGGKSLTTPLPDIHLTDIGKDSGGASPAEIADEIISAITKYSSSAASSIDLSALGLSDISGKAADVIKDVKGAVGGAVEDAMSGTGDVGTKAKDAMKDAGGALKGLFGN
ncbi:MAG: hypothetical protein COB59_10770 [Rhodospirillaceae bacterium]|nr:MAG: hypothetical protein COB59_10770 [Rhodospirillaceae bacterium]